MKLRIPCLPLGSLLEALFRSLLRFLCGSCRAFRWRGCGSASCLLLSPELPPLLAGSCSSLSSISSACQASFFATFSALSSLALSFVGPFFIGTLCTTPGLALALALAFSPGRNRRSHHSARVARL